MWIILHQRRPVRGHPTSAVIVIASLFVCSILSFACRRITVGVRAQLWRMRGHKPDDCVPRGRADGVSIHTCAARSGKGCKGSRLSVTKMCVAACNTAFPSWLRSLPPSFRFTSRPLQKI